MENNKYFEELIVKFLDRSINLTEKEELHNWLKDSKENQKLFMDYSNIWSVKIELDTDLHLETLSERMQAQDNKHRLVWKRPVFIALSVAAAIALIILFVELPGSYPSSEIATFAKSGTVEIKDLKDVQLTLSDEETVYLSEKESFVKYDEKDKINLNEETSIAKEKVAKYNQLVTPRGKRSSITFADGTIAKVNSGTRVIYPVEFDTKQREIYVDGEIYLDVKPNKECPFVVKTKNTDVQVLGTSFNVSAYEDEDILEVVLVSGSVKVQQNDKKYKDEFLKPSQKYSIQNGISKVEEVDVDQYISWTKGLYIFDGERLDIILSRLMRYYGVTIKYDKEVATLPCSGKLDLKDNLEAVLESLESTAPIIHLTGEDGEHYIKSKK